MSRPENSPTTYGQTSLNHGSAAHLGDVHNSGLTIIQHATIVQHDALLLQEHALQIAALEKELADIKTQLASHKRQIEQVEQEAGSLITTNRWEDVLILSVVELHKKAEQLLELQRRIFANLMIKYEAEARNLRTQLQKSVYNAQKRIGGDTQQADVMKAIHTLDEADRKAKRAEAEAHAAGYRRGIPTRDAPNLHSDLESTLGAQPDAAETVYMKSLEKALHQDTFELGDAGHRNSAAEVHTPRRHYQNDALEKELQMVTRQLTNTKDHMSQIQHENDSLREELVQQLTRQYEDDRLRRELQTAKRQLTSNGDHMSRIRQENDRLREELQTVTQQLGASAEAAHATQADHELETQRQDTRTLRSQTVAPEEHLRPRSCGCCIM